MRTLHLASPVMHGVDVERAQDHLRTNRYGNFHPGETDGEYGPHSAAATKRAKYWLGYVERQINHAYDDQLRHYLNGDENLSIWKKVRRKKRLAAKHPLRERAIKVARRELNVRESPPNSNHVKYSYWYGMPDGPWCAMFVSWCYVQAGSKKFVKGERYAYTPFLQYAIRHGWYGFRELSLSQVKEGDIVLYDWDGDGLPNHVGLFEKWVERRAGTFFAIEGNTGVGNDSDGGAVERRLRYTYQVSCWGRQEQ